MTLRALALHDFWRSGNNSPFAVIPWVKTMEMWFAFLLAQGLTTLPWFSLLCSCCTSPSRAIYWISVQLIIVGLNFLTFFLHRIMVYSVLCSFCSFIGLEIPLCISQGFFFALVSNHCTVIPVWLKGPSGHPPQEAKDLLHWLKQHRW